MTEDIEELYPYPDLGKWPRLVVAGESVTPDQAAEIIIRTNGFYYGTNDREWDAALRVVLGLPDDSHGLDSYHAELAVWDSLGRIGLSYLSNSRLGSAYIYGPAGWINWDGTVGSSRDNIGKWPSVTEVLSDWEVIADAFPYLNLQAQLFPEEGAAPAAVEFIVKDGKVAHQKPTLDLQPTEGDLSGFIDSIKSEYGWNGRERATVSLDYIKEHADRIKKMFR
jgi:hypothetical protein